MESMLYVRDQASILTDIRRRMRDPGGRRWEDPEIYGAINEAMNMWHDRVIIPNVYTITDGWDSGTMRYTLPSYIRGMIDPQQKRYTYDYLNNSVSSTTEDAWVDILNFQVMPDGTGGFVVQFPDYLDSGDGRIIWWSHNGPVPVALPTINTTINSSATTLIVDTTEEIAETGYLKIGSEWLSYAGIAVAASTVTLSNLTRGLFNTTAASHNSAVEVAWGIAADTRDLFNQLYNYVQAELHGLFLTDGAEQEQAHHERMRLHYLDLADRFWTTYAPARAPKIRLDRRGVGDGYGMRF